MANTQPQLPNQPQQNPTAVSELANFKKELERQKVFENNLPLWAKVESWVLEEGQKIANPISPDLWTNEATAKKDLDAIFKKFPEFEKLFDSIKDNSPEKKQHFIKILQERIETKIKSTQNSQEKLTKLSEAVGKDWTKDVIDFGLERFDKWKDEGPAGYAKIAGAGALLYFAAYKGIKTVWDTITGVIGPGKPMLANLVFGGGLVAASVYGLKQVFNPRDPNTEKHPDNFEFAIESSDANNVDSPQDTKKLESIIATHDGAKAFLGLMHVPAADALEAYENRDQATKSIDPKFLLNSKYIQTTGKFSRKWIRRMVSQIKGPALYATVHSTVSLFESSHGYQEAKKSNPDLKLVDYLRKEYVDDSRTVIEFPELTAIALEAHNKNYAEIVASQDTDKAKQKVLRAIAATRRAYSNVFVDGIEALLYAGGNAIYLPLETGGRIVYDIATESYEYAGKKYADLESTIADIRSRA